MKLFQVFVWPTISSLCYPIYYCTCNPLAWSSAVSYWTVKFLYSCYFSPGIFKSRRLLQKQITSSRRKQHKLVSYKLSFIKHTVWLIFFIAVRIFFTSFPPFESCQELKLTLITHNDAVKPCSIKINDSKHVLSLG